MPQNKFIIIFIVLVLFKASVGATDVAAQVLDFGSGGGYQAPFDEARGVHSFAPVLKNVSQGVVRILAFKVQKNEDGKAFPKLVSTGTGVIVNAKKGLIVTNLHVISKADFAFIETHEGKRLEAEFLGGDSPTDLAVLKSPLEAARDIKFVDSETLKVGDIVFAIGYPSGLDQTVSSGIISGLDRYGFTDLLKNQAVESFIQTDASINSGNSGGPLIDSAGRVVGINTFILTKSGGNNGLGFAVPSKIVLRVVDQLVQFGRVERGYLGVGAETLKADTAESLGVGVNSGVVVTAISAGSPAVRAGLKIGDVITGAGPDTIHALIDLLNFVRLARAGVPYNMYVHRGSEILKLSVSLDPLTNNATSRLKKTNRVSNANSFYGATFAGLPSVVSGGVGRSGVKVTKVQANSLAARRGLKVGDIVREVNRKKFSDLPAFLLEMKQSDGSKVLKIQRGDEEFLAIFSG